MQHEVIEIKLLQKKRLVIISFSDQKKFELSCEYLRVFSPSAEVRGHHPSEMKRVVGKENVNIVAIEPVGNYAVKFIFDDGHQTGIYSWDFLYDLGMNFAKNWANYSWPLENNQKNQ